MPCGVDGTRPADWTVFYRLYDRKIDPPWKAADERGPGAKKEGRKEERKKKSTSSKGEKEGPVCSIRLQL